MSIDCIVLAFMNISRIHSSPHSFLRLFAKQNLLKLKKKHLRSIYLKDLQDDVVKNLF